MCTSAPSPQKKIGEGAFFSERRGGCTVLWPRGEYSWEFLVGVCRRILQILTLFQTKKCNFPHPFSDQTSKIHTCFQTWPLRRNYVIITWNRAQTKKLFKSIWNSHISVSYCLYSFGIKTINTLKHSSSSLKNHIRFHTKMDKVDTRFQTKPSQRLSASLVFITCPTAFLTLSTAKNV